MRFFKNNALDNEIRKIKGLPTEGKKAYIEYVGE